MRLHNLPIFAGVMLASITTAHATQDRGWYVGLEAGVNILEDADAIADHTDFGVPDGTIEFDNGWAGFLTGGYAFTPNWRAELELGIRSNDLDAVCTPGCFPTTGDVSQFTQMLNVIYDWQLGERWSLATGLGVGGNYVEVDTVFGSDQDYVLAGQAIVGLNYHLSRRMDLVLNYRYMATEELNFVSTDPLDPGELYFLDVDGVSNHSISIGLRYDLHPTVAAPKVVTPQPQPEPARQYIVFFGFNKSNLTSEAQQVVAEAAAAAKQMGTATIIVTGHTDTVGGNAYNNRLSQRRADVVRDELSRQGVTSKIVANGKGETELLVQTADNVKEPQNRRATIDLQ
jgi:OmpA-OmpF porin, OOP family